MIISYANNLYLQTSKRRVDGSGLRSHCFAEDRWNYNGKLITYGIKGIGILSPYELMEWNDDL